MEGKEKGVEREGVKEEFMVKKLKRGVFVGRKAGPSTPSPIWRLEFTSPTGNNESSIAQEFVSIPTTAVSARKLCANLWEIQRHHLPLDKMPKRVSKHKHKDPTDNPLHQPESTCSLRRHVAASPRRHCRSIEQISRNLRPVTPANYGSSVEVAPYKPTVSPTCSLRFKDKLGESSYSLKMSTELLKVLNRIWSLEEQQVSNVSMMKGLKTKLNQSQAKTKELLKEKQKDGEEMDELIKRVAEDKIVRKNKEKERIHAAIQSVKGELEDERKLRKRSESLDRKLAREISEIKSSFSNTLKDLERERKARILLENLCDEFAKGIRNYEEEVRSLRHKPQSSTDHVFMDNADRLILHISEAWLDERMQMRIAESQNNLIEKNIIVDKLSLDIENFLRAKCFTVSSKQGNPSENDKKNICSGRLSLESFPLNEAGSAPRDDTEAYNTLEGHLEEMVNSNSIKRKSQSRNKERSQGIQGAIKGGICSLTEEGLLERKNEGLESDGSKSNRVMEDLIRNRSTSSDGDKIHPVCDLKDDCFVQSVFTGNASPVHKWVSKLKSPDFDKPESSAKVLEVLKGNTLRAKLLEARLESQQSRSKPTRSPS